MLGIGKYNNSKQQKMLKFLNYNKTRRRKEEGDDGDQRLQNPSRMKPRNSILGISTNLVVFYFITMIINFSAVILADNNNNNNDDKFNSAATKQRNIVHSKKQPNKNSYQSLSDEISALNLNTRQMLLTQSSRIKQKFTENDSDYSYASLFENSDFMSKTNEMKENKDTDDSFIPNNLRQQDDSDDDSDSEYIYPIYEVDSEVKPASVNNGGKTKEIIDEDFDKNAKISLDFLNTGDFSQLGNYGEDLRLGFFVGQDSNFLIFFLISLFF